MEDVFGALITALASVLLAVAGLAVNRLADWLKLSADSQVREYLMAAASRGIELAVARVAAQVAEGSVPASRAYPAVVEEASAYLQNRVPDALRRFRIDALALEGLVAARLHEDGHRPEDLLPVAQDAPR